MLPHALFRHCPQCGATLARLGTNPMRCACGFTYYFNPAIGAASFVRRADGLYLFVRRERDPGKGLLTVPGGFVDIGETAETAVIREVREEVGVELADLRYVCSLTNEYPYKGVTYPVCDFMFHADAVDSDAAHAGDGTAAFEWRRLDDVDPAELAFPSVRRGRELLLANLRTDFSLDIRSPKRNGCR
jgi:NAD+ diphosphatase